MPMNARTVRSLVRLASKALRAFQSRPGSGGPRRLPERARPSGGTGATPGFRGWSGGTYPGDYTGHLRPVYSPKPDGLPDPGEIVWTWVPYEEDYRQGKDRPVLLVGNDGGLLLGLMLTSKDNSREGHLDRHYVDIGAGPWDGRGRPSEVKINRVIRVDPGGIRREGSVLGKRAFDLVVRALAAG